MYCLFRREGKKEGKERGGDFPLPFVGKKARRHMQRRRKKSSSCLAKRRGGGGEKRGRCAGGGKNKKGIGFGRTSPIIPICKREGGGQRSLPELKKRRNGVVRLKEKGSLLLNRGKKGKRRPLTTKKKKGSTNAFEREGLLILFSRKEEMSLAGSGGGGATLSRKFVPYFLSHSFKGELRRENPEGLRPTRCKGRGTTSRCSARRKKDCESAVAEGGKPSLPHKRRGRSFSWAEKKRAGEKEIFLPSEREGTPIRNGVG